MNFDALIDQALQQSPHAAKAKTELKSVFGLDELNLEYFLALYRRYRASQGAGGKEAALEIHEAGRDGVDKTIAYPTAIAADELMSQLPHAQYNDLIAAKNRYVAHARKATLWIQKMQAGTGSSMTRTSYLARIRGISAESVRIGAKGTDLYTSVKTPHGQTQVSLAELQILQALHDAREGVFGEVILKDIVSTETEQSLEAIWNKPSLVDPTKTYLALIKDLPGVRRSGRSFQSHIPTIDDQQHVSTKRLAPGGHALFALDALRAAYKPELRPKAGKSEYSLVAVVGNGEDLSSTPDAEMVGWMLAETIPIAMITTEKTENDLKGGQIALVRQADGRVFATIVEAAQAERAGQQRLFEELGLRPGDAMAFFNTNVALFNYAALAPLVTKLVGEIGEQEFMGIIAPDLIQNKKAQVDADGVKRTYVQLEGAMGSSLLRLDQYWRARHGSPLVHFVNVDRMNRTRFFSPVKTAFDFFMQFHSDRFTLDAKSMRLENRRPGTLPAVILNDKATGNKHYADVEHVLNAFKGTSVVGLNMLEVEGQVDFSGLTLRGKIKVVNNSGREARLADHVRGTVVENTEIQIP